MSCRAGNEELMLNILLPRLNTSRRCDKQRNALEHVFLLLLPKHSQSCAERIAAWPQHQCAEMALPVTCSCCYLEDVDIEVDLLICQFALPIHIGNTFHLYKSVYRVVHGFWDRPVACTTMKRQHTTTLMVRFFARILLLGTCVQRQKDNTCLHKVTCWLTAQSRYTHTHISPMPCVETREGACRQTLPFCLS